MASTSPSNVLEAYYKQFQRDFSIFLNCRAEELVEGGRMVLTCLGRKSDDPSSKEGCYILELLAMVLNEMVLQGIIKDDKLNTFNIPWYTPSPSEVKLQVVTEGSFSIDRLEVFEVNWNTLNNEKTFDSEVEISDGYIVAQGMRVAQGIRAIFESLLVSHFGEAIIEEIFNRFGKILIDRMSKEINKFFFVTISLTRKHNQ
ncbi:unnamed protein product [Trifolium pratense]|uniref:Uncharacterized protein n=1 Tax=Trifolium pratense TaxID=57577 RepID=A0ACB0IVL1_TRIPR|nr:unnamed protein product [Trifolium pratense]